MSFQGDFRPHQVSDLNLLFLLFPTVELLGKTEFSNPSGSIKDRVAQRVLANLKAANKIKDSTTLVVPSSGNLVISLALLSPQNGHYKVIGLVPERTSEDRIQFLKSLGVEIVRTPIEAHADSAESQFSIAKKIATDLQDAVLVDEVKGGVGEFMVTSCGEMHGLYFAQFT
jgi:cystathionine beta-synthase